MRVTRVAELKSAIKFFRARKKKKTTLTVSSRMSRVEDRDPCTSSTRRASAEVER